MLRQMHSAVAVVITLILATTAVQAQTVWYVDEGGPPVSGCTSWEDACPELQTALDQAGAGDQIWVAVGTYTPSARTIPDNPRSATFQLICGVEMYGGFNPYDEIDETVLTGDLDGNDAVGGEPNDPSRVDNSYNVVSSVRVAPCSKEGLAAPILDGFAITAGNADTGGNPSVSSSTGGGLLNRHSSPYVSNCIFRHNWAKWGGGMSNLDGSSPQVCNSLFIGNGVVDDGGGMHNKDGSNPVVVNCVFSGNTANDGGGLYNDTSHPEVTNCTFSLNTASASGGGMEVYANSHATVVNSIFWSNSTNSGDDQNAQIRVHTNSSAAVEYSCIHNLTPGGDFDNPTNTSEDPLLKDADGEDDTPGTMDDNVRLLPGSPAIDAGNNDAVPGECGSSDLDGNPRFADCDEDCDVVVDMGAYEFQCAAPCSADLDGDGVVGAADLAILLGSWGECDG